VNLRSAYESGGGSAITGKSRQPKSAHKLWRCIPSLSPCCRWVVRKRCPRVGKWRDFQYGSSPVPSGWRPTTQRRHCLVSFSATFSSRSLTPCSARCPTHWATSRRSVPSLRFVPIPASDPGGPEDFGHSANSSPRLGLPIKGSTSPFGTERRTPPASHELRYRLRCSGISPPEQGHLPFRRSADRYLAN